MIYLKQLVLGKSLLLEITPSFISFLVPKTSTVLV